MEDKNQPKYHYYQFYNVNGTRTFHSPIEEKDVFKYNLEVIKIDQLQTEGHDITDLVSNQFVNKVLILIETDDFQLILSNQESSSKDTAS